MNEAINSSVTSLSHVTGKLTAAFVVFLSLIIPLPSLRVHAKTLSPALRLFEIRPRYHIKQLVTMGTLQSLDDVLEPPDSEPCNDKSIINLGYRSCRNRDYKWDVFRMQDRAKRVPGATVTVCRTFCGTYQDRKTLYGEVCHDVT